MRIVAVEPSVVDIPLARPVHGVHGITSTQRSVLVRVRSDDGIDGWGDVDPTAGYSLMTAEGVWRTVDRLSPRLMRLDPFNVNHALAMMVRNAAGCRKG